MKANQLARWILGLPEEIQNGAVCGIVGGGIFTAKRVVAYDTGSDCGIYVEPMGTHAEPPAGTIFPSYIDYCNRIRSTDPTQQKGDYLYDIVNVLKDCPDLTASVVHTGGGIHNIVVIHDTSKFKFVWGDMNDTWGADVYNQDGDLLEHSHIDSYLPSHITRHELVAIVIAGSIRNLFR